MWSCCQIVKSCSAVLVLSCWLCTIAAENATCVWHGIVYQEMESVTGDPCDRCTCTQFGATCVWHGIVYQEMESVTGDPCDRCTCTQFGVMCELIHCPQAMCVDVYIPEGQCCPVCPSGNNCLYFENRQKKIIPERGCELNSNLQCFCHEARRPFFNRMTLQPYCIPKLPFFNLPKCKIAPV